MINRSGGEKDSITAPNLITEQATSDAEVAISVPTTSVPADMDASLSTTNSKAVDNTIPHNTSIVHANEVSTSSEHLSFEANKSTDAPPILSEKPDDPGHTGESTRNDGNLNDNHPQNPAKQHEPMGEEPMGDKPMGDETKQKEIKQQASDSHGESDVADDENDDDPFAGLDEVATLDLHSISNYTFGKKGTKSKSKSMSDMSSRLISNALQNDYERRGLRRSVRAVILVHEHNFAHLLLLQRSDGKGEFALPGGRLRAGENFEQGLLRKLSAKLCPDESISHGTDGKNKEDEYMTDNPSLEVGDKCKMLMLLPTLTTSLFSLLSINVSN